MTIKHLRRGIAALWLAAALLLPTGCNGNTSLDTSVDTSVDTSADTVADVTEIETEESSARQELLQIYISPDGSAEGDGTAQNPVDSLQTAVEKLRESATCLPREIILMDGDYYMTKGVQITAEDMNTWFSSLTIRAENSGKVRLIGGLKVDSSLCKPVSDPAILDRIIDAEAAGKLMMLDLSNVVEEFRPVSLYNPMEVYMDGQVLTCSRWPNDQSDRLATDDYLRAEAVISVGENPKDQPMTFTYADAGNRALQWSEEGMRDLYVLSYLGVDWRNDMLKVTGMDPANRSVTLENGGIYGATAGNRFFFFNILDEIDVPGECYVDREARIVYFYPYEDTAQEIFLSVTGEALLTLTNVQNVTVEGISFAYTRGRAIQASGVEDVAIRDCDVLHTSDMAMSLNGTRITVDGCEIGDTWAGGISMSGGDRVSLTSGENVIQNCVIHDFNRSLETYKPAIWAESVGMVIRNNTFYNATHQVIKIFTNNARILNNEFYHCCTEASDMGVIYFGQDPTMLGMEIGYNYFHENGNLYGGIGQFAIYIDDGSAGAYIHHNLFHNATPVDPVIRLHGAQYSRIEGNLFSDVDSAVFNAHWPGEDAVKQYEWLLWLCDLAPNRRHDIQERIKAAGMNSEIWENAYRGTQWEPLVMLVRDGVDQAILKAQAEGKTGVVNKLLRVNAPYNSNTLTNNIFLNMDLYNSYTPADAPFYGEGILRGGATVVENNVLVAEDDFVAYGTDFALTEAGLTKVQERIPEFENFSMSQIGPQKSE